MKVFVSRKRPVILRADTLWGILRRDELPLALVAVARRRDGPQGHADRTVATVRNGCLLRVRWPGQLVVRVRSCAQEAIGTVGVFV